MTASLRALVVLLIALLAAAALLSGTSKAPLVEASAAPTAATSGFAPLPAAAPAGAQALLARSPFAPDRGAFSRAQAAPVVEASLEVRLIAVFTVAGAPRATLSIGGSETTVAVGDETAAGLVAAIEQDAVVLGAGTGRRVGFFD